MYTILFIHSWVRWILLLLLIVVIVRSFAGWLGRQSYSKADNALAGSLVGFFHLQLILGLGLFFWFSPIMDNIWNLSADQLAQAYLSDIYDQLKQSGESLSKMKVIMKSKELRFWAVEHIAVNIIAVVFAQVGRSRAKRLADAVKKHQTQAIFFTIALVLILSRIPWTEAGRLFRTF